ncbi:MAG: ribonuclease P protein component [Bacteriovoracaceae bacterium]|jgi:ribonuclease P protein component|nr:ribonuclease P protein component [Bacteriovoracaceae bacterium]
MLSKIDELKVEKNLQLQQVQNSSSSYPISKTFRPENRLRLKNDFSYLREAAKRLSSGVLNLYYKDSLVPSNGSRVAFSISKKVGKANVRNRIKRILREKYRNSESLRDFPNDMLFVVNWRKTKKLSMESLEESIHASFERIERDLKC